MFPTYGGYEESASAEALPGSEYHCVSAITNIKY
jgi:hypothetical protein